MATLSYNTSGDMIPTPVDAIEKKILKGRLNANAIASQAINRCGVGHKYCGHFSHKKRAQIELLGNKIYEALYAPPLKDTSIRTSDVPVAECGYISLPFIFDLVNLVNRIANGQMKDKDEDGNQTVDFLVRFRKRLRLITTDYDGSLGFHPLVYFYTRGGAF